MIERDGQRLKLSGAITIASVARECDAGKQQLADGDVVDLSGVKEVDSSALSLIFELQREAKRRTLHISFSNLPASLQSLATLYGVADLLGADAQGASQVER